ncbi:hypothetical protein SAMN05216464_1277 [Mucilaginibacter pineti]|uniref:Uncharacterized protein n=1 Tax=Mucilaginibacter pineti TaxID=1391627 RepID=A0A1G7NGI1_9SPHI|nr:hypothetical protein [Mucilaginibacter pineti]SDF73076.1 hypothetical protein SAMN05216464_1277 [Mucilaginibacter pineti]
MKFLVAVLGTALGAITQQVIAKDEPGTDSTIEIIAIAACVICLIFLAIKLFKNTILLDKAAEEEPERGEKWVASHLKELNSDQLDTLLKQHEISSKSNHALEN